MKKKENILVSACLLGVHCRYCKESTAHKAVVNLMDMVNLIPICPEQLGGLKTPREPAERKENQVFDKKGNDVTREFKQGAIETLKLAKMYGCKTAILKERSPSCGSSFIYDGSFQGRVIPGKGMTAELLEENGITVISEEHLS